MSGETLITVVGNLTGDPELRFTPSGAAVANFTIAARERGRVPDQGHPRGGPGHKRMKERWSHQAKGLVLRSRVTGLVYVCYEMTTHGDWNACPLFDPHGVYTPEGYNVLVSKEDVETAERCVVQWNEETDAP